MLYVNSFCLHAGVPGGGTGNPGEPAVFQRPEHPGVSRLDHHSKTHSCWRSPVLVPHHRWPASASRPEWTTRWWLTETWLPSPETKPSCRWRDPTSWPTSRTSASRRWTRRVERCVPVNSPVWKRLLKCSRCYFKDFEHWLCLLPPHLQRSLSPPSTSPPRSPEVRFRGISSVCLCKYDSRAHLHANAANDHSRQLTAVTTVRYECMSQSCKSCVRCCSSKLVKLQWWARWFIL